MSITDLIIKIKKSSKKMTKSQRKQRLIDAHIIKENGEYDPKYFTPKTVGRSKNYKK